MAAIVLFVSAPVASHAQRVATIAINADLASMNDRRACTVTTSETVPSSSAPATGDDSIIVQVRADSNPKTPSTLRFPLRITRDYETKATLAKGVSSIVVSTGSDGLVGHDIRVFGVDSLRPLCASRPFMSATSFRQPRYQTTHTDIIASGEVSNALRSGSDKSMATGTLGFHHLSYPDPDVRDKRFPWFFAGNRAIDQDNWWGKMIRGTSIAMDGEDLRTVISVAGSMDSVTGTHGGNFAQAILLPANGGTGGWKSVDLEYFPHTLNTKHQAFGPVLRIAATESRWAPDSLGGKYSSRVAVLVAIDVRIKAILINRVSEVDDNSLSFALDGGYIQRSVGGDITARSNAPVLIAALDSTPRTRFSGWAIGTSLRLRQVTAFADFQCLSCKFLGRFGTDTPNIPSLEGLQPIIGFRFEAPFFTVL